MTDNKNHPKKILDLKPHERGGGRVAHSKLAQFIPDEELIQSTSRIKNQRDVILERIHRMETSSDRVSGSVFEKVKRDYGLQLDTITELLNEKKQILRDEIRKLYMIREKLTVEVNRHREILEEADFRHYLGEFTQSQYQEVENFETKEIEKSEADLAHINQWIRTHEELFDARDFGREETRAPATSDVTQTAYRPTPQQQPAPQPQAQAPAPTPEPAASDDFSHLFDEGEPVAEEPAAAPNIDQLIQEVQSSAEATAATPESDPFAAEPEKKTLAETPEPELSADPETTPAPAEDNNYFEDENIQEASFKIHPEELEGQPETEGDINPGESVTVARTAVKTPEPTDPKDDSISDILENIRLEGEDDLDSAQASFESNEGQIQTDYKLKLTQGDLDLKEYPMKANTSIGRSPSNDVVLKEPKVSRQHAAINLYNDQYILVDLKSSNGVYVNGTKVDETVLHAGDEVSIGGYKFLFVKND